MESETGKNTQEVNISFLRIDSGTLLPKKDFVATEEPLHIFINRKHYVTLLCSPINKHELAVGHLVSEGLIKSPDEIKEIKMLKNGKCKVSLKPGVDVQARFKTSLPFSRLILSACGSPTYWPLSKLTDRIKIPKVKSQLLFDAKTISEATHRLNKLPSTFRITGGVHVAALYSHNGTLIGYAEDVGRHNAVDKVIGRVLLEKRDLHESFLSSTGRLTGDIVLKAARLQIPLVSSLASAVSSGVEIANVTGITLIGFVRGRRMNIYTHPERILLK